MAMTNKGALPSSAGAVLLALTTAHFVVPTPTASMDTDDDHVVAHWRFQRGIPGHKAHSTRLILDSSGNDRHGQAHGGPRFRSVKLPGSNLALTFDGHRVHIPDHELFYLTQSLTLEAYIQVDRYPSQSSMFGNIVFRGDSRPGFDPWYLAVAASGQLTFHIADALNECSVVRSPKPVPIGKLVHVAGTLDDRTGEQSLFINGQRVATEKTGVRAAGALGGVNPGIGIGGTQDHSNQTFHGTIDELRVSHVALGRDQLLPPPRVVGPRNDDL